MFVDQVKNARAALFDVALERSHWRRLVCRLALGKMQRKAMIKCRNLPGNTVSWHALSEIEVNCCTQFEEQNREEICLAASEAQGSAVRQSLVLIVRRRNSGNRGPMCADTIRHQ